MQCRPRSPALWLFTQPFIMAQIKKIKVLRHWPLCEEFLGDRWIPRTKSQWRGKCFHLMTSSCSWICLLIHYLILMLVPFIFVSRGLCCDWANPSRPGWYMGPRRIILVLADGTGHQWPLLLTWINFDPNMVTTSIIMCGVKLLIHS